jgi:hypothetical protein
VNEFIGSIEGMNENVEKKKKTRFICDSTRHSKVSTFNKCYFYASIDVLPAAVSFRYEIKHFFGTFIPSVAQKRIKVISKNGA